MIYELLLTIGGLGLTAQVALGFVHSGHAHGGQSHEGHAGHGHEAPAAHGHEAPTVYGHSGSHGAQHSHDAQSSHDSHGHEATLTPKLNVSFLLWLSPLNLFSVALGAGATGLALRPFLREEWLTAVCAALGGIALLVLLVRPLWSLILRFQSQPAETLAGIVTQEGTASSRFDAQGRGVVRVTVDGASVRLLAVFDADERMSAATVAPGDRLLVTGIDATRNQCRVTKL